MKRLCCGLILAALGGSAAAAWERVGVADDDMVVYADRATIQKSGDVVKMWSLLDYKTAEKDDTGKPYLSAKLLHDYNCKDERARTRYFSIHAGPMGAGQLVNSEVRGDSEWLPAGRTFIGETLFRIACGKK
jgi:Surface-adhesin protein E